jgi:NADH-quinone oxidoreductase subunit D
VRHVGVTIKADVPDDDLVVDSWVTVFAGANWHERETHEMFGIGFAGHPDLRNMYLPGDFEGYPLRKDFPLLARMVKPWPGIVDVEPMPRRRRPADARRGAGRRGGELMTVLVRPPAAELHRAQAADARLNVELETEGMTLNIGPQHPATHGTLRIIARLDGEQVVWAEPSAGYMHRGYEKLTEVRTFPQVTTLINRIDWLGSFANEVPFILAAEKLMEIEAPPRAQWIRTILFELSRIANVSLFLGDLGVQMGAITPVSRLPRPRVRPQPDRGRHRRTLPPELRPHRRPQGRPAEGLDRRDPSGDAQAPRSATRSTTCCSATRSSRAAPAASGDPGGGREAVRPVGREPARQRRRLGPAPRPVAADGVGQGRLQGLDPPRRRQLRPVLGAPAGDSRATKIVDQLLDGIPSGPVMAKVPRIIKVPEGEAWVSTENPLGEMGYYVVSKGDLGPFRVKIRSASFNNISIVPWVLKGVYVPDIITILASLYFILGDIDR